jgi:uncharacterized protein
VTSSTKSFCDGPVRALPDGIALRLKVAPRARHDRIEGTVPGPDGPVLKVSVTAAPERGRANAAVIALIARELRIPKTSISVVAGETGRSKTLKIAGEPAALAQLLEQHRASWK